MEENFLARLTSTLSHENIDYTVTVKHNIAVASYVKVVRPIFNDCKLCAKHTTKHAKHGAARGSGGMPPGKFEKLALLRLNLVHFLTNI